MVPILILRADHLKWSNEMQARFHPSLPMVEQVGAAMAEMDTSKSTDQLLDSM